MAADRKQGRPEARALEVVIEKLQRIAQELGSVGAVLPGYSTGSVQKLLQQAKTGAPEEMDKLLDTPASRRVAEDFGRLAARNRVELDEAERYVAALGTVDNFEANIGELLRVAFYGWDDGGDIQPINAGVVSVRVPARLRNQLGTPVIERATFRRDVAVAGADDRPELVPEFLSPAHPLVEATLQALRDEATDPAFLHRFDIVADEPEGLVLSFAIRFVDGEGRTAEESLLAVEVALDGTVSEDGRADMARLGVDDRGSAYVPDSTRVQAWTEAFPSLVADARAELERRTELRREELVELAAELQADELTALGLWRGEEERRVERLSFGSALQLSFEDSQEYERRMRGLEAEFERRRAVIRDRSHVRLVGIDLVGGRLIVRSAS